MVRLRTPKGGFGFCFDPLSTVGEHQGDGPGDDLRDEDKDTDNADGQEQPRHHRFYHLFQRKSGDILCGIQTHTYGRSDQTEAEGDDQELSLIHILDIVVMT